MLFRQMFWVPHRLPVCVYEKLPKGAFQSDLRLVFLGRLAVLPVVFLGANGYFGYLADRQVFRSAVFSELKHIMSAASLDNTYYVEDWFMKKGRLLVHVAKKAQKVKRELDSPWKRAASWLRRLSTEFR